MPLDRALEYTLFTFWVSICAFAPELIWQGFVYLRGHFGPVQAYSALFIGMLFAFFIDPLLERLKQGRWRLPDEHRKGVVLPTLLSLAFGVVVVCLHEAMIAYLGGGRVGEQEKLAKLGAAMDQVREWASIPAAVTATWFVAGTWPRLAGVAAACACVWIVAVGFLYHWGLLIVVTTALPSCVIALLGIRVVRRSWGPGTFPGLAWLVAGVAGGWLILAWMAGPIVQHLLGPGLEYYSSDAFPEDFRFYLGWSAGLALAPDPVTSHEAGA